MDHVIVLVIIVKGMVGVIMVNGAHAVHFVVVVISSEVGHVIELIVMVARGWRGLGHLRTGGDRGGR